MSDNYFSTHNFEINIDGMKAKQFAEVDGLEMSIENLPYQEGAMHLQRSRKGRTRYSDITLRRRFDGDKELVHWFRDCSQKAPDKRNGSVILKDDNGKEIYRFNFTAAWPSRYKAPLFSTLKENQVSLEEINLSIETIEIG